MRFLVFKYYRKSASFTVLLSLLSSCRLLYTCHFNYYYFFCFYFFRCWLRHTWFLTVADHALSQHQYCNFIISSNQQASSIKKQVLFKKKESLISFFLSWDTSAPLTSLSLCAAFIPVRVSLFFVLKINLQTNNSVFSPLFLIRLLAGLVRGRAQVSNLDLAESFCSRKKKKTVRERFCVACFLTMHFR